MADIAEKPGEGAQIEATAAGERAVHGPLTVAPSPAGSPTAAVDPASTHGAQRVAKGPSVPRRS